MIDTFARHKVAANLLMVMMILIGFWAVRVMPSQRDPPADFPIVVEDVQWIGARAEDVETLVTIPIEGAPPSQVVLVSRKCDPNPMIRNLRLAAKAVLTAPAA